MKRAVTLCALLAAVVASSLHAAERITVAAASSLQPAMRRLADAFQRQQPGSEVMVIYGATGKLQTQIQQGAPFDLFFAADTVAAQALFDAGFAASAPRIHAKGRLVLWSTGEDVRNLMLIDLDRARFPRIAIANPRVAPYGARAVEALQNTGMWQRVQSQLVQGENIAQAAQFVATGNAQVGLLALSQVVVPPLSEQGSYRVLPERLHGSLSQSFVITRRAANKPLAQQFADYLATPEAGAILVRHGFERPAP